MSLLMNSDKFRLTTLRDNDNAKKAFSMKFLDV